MRPLPPLTSLCGLRSARAEVLFGFVISIFIDIFYLLSRFSIFPAMISLSVFLTTAFKFFSATSDAWAFWRAASECESRSLFSAGLRFAGAGEDRRFRYYSSFMLIFT